MEDEVILADLGVVERRLERLERDLKKGNNAGAAQRSRTSCIRCRTALEDGQPLRALGLLGRRRQAAARLSVSLGQAAAARAQSRRSRSAAGRRARCSIAGLESFMAGAATRAVPICAKIELEIAQLDPADAAAFMADLGLRESGLDRVIRASYDLLGYISFFTVGEDECRAWSIPRDTPAVLAAGEIHSDISRGFIRAEVVALRAADRARHARRLPRSRRAAARGQGIHRPRRRRDQFPPRHVEQGHQRTVKTILVCEAQVPFVHGGAEVHVRELVRELRARGYRGRARQRPVQVVSEGGDPAARRGVAAARSEREQRPADRSRDRLEVSDLFRPPSEQGRVADPPVPRRLRAVRHAVQRLRPHRAGRRPARHADPARHRDARRVPRDLRERAEHRGAAGEIQRPVGRARSTIRRGSRRG